MFLYLLKIKVDAESKCLHLRIYVGVDFLASDDREGWVNSLGLREEQDVVGRSEHAKRIYVHLPGD